MTADPPLHAAPATPRNHPGDAVLRRLADQRLQLQLVATSLAQPLDAHGVAACVAEAAVGVLGASGGWVALLSPDGLSLELLHAIGEATRLSDGTAVGASDTWRRISLELDTPITRAILTDSPVYHPSAAARERDFPALVGYREVAPGAEASAAVPFHSRGCVTGGLGITFDERRDLDEDERWFLESLASQAAQGLERAQLFAELQERDERLRFALEASGTGTWEWDLATDRLTWSGEVYRLHGMAVDDDQEPPRIDAWMAMLHEDDRAEIAEKIRACIETGGTYDVEFRVRLPDGDWRWLHSVGRAAPGPDGRPARLSGTTLDVTARRLAELERDRVVEAEREAARLRDAFTGVVSHELRTPITTIFGGTRVLARRWRDMEPETRDGILADVVEEADRLYRLVEDLLVLTRVERGALDIGDEPIHLGRVMERVVASERPRWNGVEFVSVVPPDLPSVAGEDTYIEQVLRNLVGNAAKYGGTGSTVTLETASEGTDVVLRVLDEGPGIAGDEADRLFELFYRAPSTAAQVSGAGIGLFVCRQLVEAMGGTIHAEPRPGRGAAFVVTLPRYEDDGSA